MKPASTRRSLLATLGGVGTAGLAGCSGLGGSQRLTLPPPPPEPVEHYTVGKIRHPEETPLFGEADSDEEIHRSNSDVLTSADDVDSLEFDTEIEAATLLRDFLADTDFSANSVYLLQVPVSACHRYRLVRVIYGNGDLDAEFCQEYRSAAVDCDPERKEMVAFAIRLPFPDISIDTLGTGSGRNCPDYDLDGSTVVNLGDQTGDGQ